MFGWLHKNSYERIIELKERRIEHLEMILENNTRMWNRHRDQIERDFSIYYNANMDLWVDHRRTKNEG